MKALTWIVTVTLLCLYGVGFAYAADSSAMQSANQAIQAHQFDVAEKTLSEEINKHPQNAEARFQLARVLAWQGKHDQALIQYDILIKKNPNNADYLLGKSYVLLWNNKPAEALPLLKRAKTLHPHYEEVWRAEIQALTATKDSANINEANALREEAKQKFPASDWSVKTPDPITQATIVKPNQVEFGAGESFLDGNYDDWRSTYLYGAHQFSQRQSVYGLARNTNRFALNDNDFLVGTTQPINDRWSSQFEASKSPTHNVVPDWSLMAGVSYAIGNGWNWGLNERRRMYESGSNSTGMMIDHYFSAYRLAYTINRGTADGGDNAIGSTIDGDYYYGLENYIRLTFSKGEELDNEYVDGNPAAPPVNVCGTLAPRGQTTLVKCSVESVAVSGRHWVAPDWAISYQANYSNQDSLYSYEGIQLGLRYRF